MKKINTYVGLLWKFTDVIGNIGNRVISISVISS